jgi:hypothetical protein
MKQIVTILFVVLSGIAFGQNVTNQFGGQPSFAGQLLSAVPSTTTVSYPCLMDFNPALGTFSDLGTTPATNNGAIAQWNDQSGHTNNVIQPVAIIQPQLVPNIVKGLPVVRFTGQANDVLYNLTVSNAQPIVFYVVLSSADFTSKPYDICYMGTSGVLGLFLTSFSGGGDLMALTEKVGGIASNTTSNNVHLATSGFNIVTAIWDTNSPYITLRTNGVTVGIATPGSGPDFPPVNVRPIGFTLSMSLFYNCDIARVIISTNATLSSVTNIEYMLRTNYITP